MQTAGGGVMVSWHTLGPQYQSVLNVVADHMPPFMPQSSNGYHQQDKDPCHSKGCLDSVSGGLLICLRYEKRDVKRKIDYL